MEEKDILSAEMVANAFDGVVLAKKGATANGKVIEARQEKLFAQDHIKTPAMIFDELSKTVLGQEEAKKSLSVILYQHLKRFTLEREGKQLPKTNALLIGPSGCGKTMLAKAMADVAKLPFLKIDATNFTQRGYRGGMHAEQIVDLLRAVAKGQRQKAQWAIVFIDEVDKLAHDRWGNDELATSGVQQDLLSIIDGGSFFYEPDHEEWGREEFSFNNILFIFGGAFGRLTEKPDITTKHLTRYGFIPEFANRLGNIIRLDTLGDEVIKKLIRKEVEDYGSYVTIASEEVHVYTEIIHTMIMASKAHEEMGGRCVGPIVRRFFEDRMFEIGKQEVKQG